MVDLKSKCLLFKMNASDRVEENTASELGSVQYILLVLAEESERETERPRDGEKERERESWALPYFTLREKTVAIFHR